MLASAQALVQEWVLAWAPEWARALGPAQEWEQASALALGPEQVSAPALAQEWALVSVLAWEPAWAPVSGPEQASAREWGPVSALA
ncbi:hypothetical protein [Roseateles sp. BYS96W]|uniref:Uncharacterized protein n=1 Tax=Pelomonas nitida TaxID=3299027 RepID=A0ABW7GBP5_9BURK